MKSPPSLEPGAGRAVLVVVDTATDPWVSEVGDSVVLVLVVVVAATDPSDSVVLVAVSVVGVMMVGLGITEGKAKSLVATSYDYKILSSYYLCHGYTHSYCMVGNFHGVQILWISCVPSSTKNIVYNQMIRVDRMPQKCKHMKQP